MWTRFIRAVFLCSFCYICILTLICSVWRKSRMAQHVFVRIPTYHLAEGISKKTNLKTNYTVYHIGNFVFFHVGHRCAEVRSPSGTKTVYKRYSDFKAFDKVSSTSCCVLFVSHVVFVFVCRHGATFTLVCASSSCCRPAKSCLKTPNRWFRSALSNWK